MLGFVSGKKIGERTPWRWLERWVEKVIRQPRLAAALRSRLSGAPVDALFPRGHYYSPLASVEIPPETARAAYGETGQMRAIPGLEVGAQGELFAELLPQLPGFLAAFHPDGSRVAQAEYAGYLLDGFTLYGLLRHQRPRRLIEVGCGYSSTITLRARQETGAPARVEFIDPDPATLRRLAGADELRGEGVEVHEKPVQGLPVALFSGLGPGDVLFIDSTHVVKFGSDVHHLFFRVLPRLARGVIVHFHDIFWPFEYPIEWLRRGYAWNEAYFLRCLLETSGQYEVILFNHFLAARRPDLVAALPAWLRKTSGSVWLRRL